MEEKDGIALGFFHPPFHECSLDSKEKSTYTLMRCFRPGKSPLQDQAKKAAPGQAKEAAQQLKALKALRMVRSK